VKTLKITTHWTTQEAAQVYEALELLKTAIWESYGNDIRELYVDIVHEQTAVGEQFNDDMDF
jgi:Ribonuclease G/E